MTKKLELAATLALTILSEGGNGEGWLINDAVVALRAGLGLEVPEEDAARLSQIAPDLFMDDPAVVVGEHLDIEWLAAGPGRGPSPWRCRACGKRGTGTPMNEPQDYGCLENEGA